MNLPYRKPPVFLDRDGTLIVEKHFLHDPDQVQMEIGVVEGLTSLQQAGHPLIVISNQSGIGRGALTEADAYRVNAKVSELLSKEGIKILAWYLCPHAPDAACSCRKPAPGMPIAASAEWGVQLAGSYVIGDKQSDLETADAIGGTGILITTGHGREHRAWAQAHGRPTFARLTEAAQYIRTCESGNDESDAAERNTQAHERGKQ